MVSVPADSSITEGTSKSLDLGATNATCCVTSTQYSLTSRDTRMPFNGVPTFRNGPGGTLSVARSYSGTVGAQVTAGAESEVGAVLARAKVSVSGALSTSNSTGSTNTYTRNIASGKMGNAQYVSYGKDISYTKYRINYNCSTTTLATGRIKYPTSTEGWYYWETTP